MSLCPQLPPTSVQFVIADLTRASAANQASITVQATYDETVISPAVIAQRAQQFYTTPALYFDLGLVLQALVLVSHGLLQYI